MDSLPALTHHLEYLFLRRIIAGLRDGTIPIDKAKLFSQEYLTIEPFASPEDAYNRSYQFVGKHPEFVELKEYLAAFDREKDVPAKVNKMREYIKQNNMAAAIQVAQA